MRNIKNNLIEIITIAGVLILLFYSSEPIMRGDSMRYLHKSLIDPPMYSSIIFIIQWLFGSLNAVVILQSILIGVGIIYLTRTISNIFYLSEIMKIFISFFLFLPIIKFYNYLLTEPISYAFSLLLVGSLIKLIYKFNRVNLIWSAVFIISLLLLRKQFIILYPIILLLYIGIFFINKSKKTLVLLVISFVSILVTHISLVSIDKHLNQNSLDKKSSLIDKYGPFYFIYIDAIYISSAKDTKLFDNQNEQKMLLNIFKEMKSQKSLIEHYNGRGHYGLSFNNIRFYSDNLIENLAKQENTNITNIQKKISFKLLKANFGKYIKHIFKKFYDSTWLFIFLPFAMLIAALINFLKHKSQLTLVIIFLSSFALANHSMVYIFGRVQPRYFIYTDFILLVFIFLFFANFLKKSK